MTTNDSKRGDESAKEFVERNQQRRPIDKQAIQEILDRVDALPTLDNRTPDEILGYDENGLPT
ncbi:MAG: hypothetical protein WBW69_16695 [Candidatus Korobacteraceae bacterium]